MPHILWTFGTTVIKEMGHLKHWDICTRATHSYGQYIGIPQRYTGNYMMHLQKAVYRQYTPIISFSPWQELGSETTDIKSSKSIEQSTKFFLVSAIPLDRFHPILAFFNMGMM